MAFPSLGLPMKRRQFITILGAAASAPVWRPAARAQPIDRARRIGMLVGLGPGDEDSQLRLAAFTMGLAASGWAVGRNLDMDYRSAERDPDRYRELAGELVALAPGVLVAGGTPALLALQQVARPNLPIV